MPLAHPIPTSLDSTLMSLHVDPEACTDSKAPLQGWENVAPRAPLTPTSLLPPPGMPLIYWFSRRMTLWGSISFNLAVFINIIIAFFYPYVEGASTGAGPRLFSLGHS